MKKKRNERRKSCTACGKLFHKKGLHHHISACEKKHVAGGNSVKFPQGFTELLRPGLKQVIEGSTVVEEPRWPYFEIACQHCGHAIEVLIMGDHATLKTNVRVGSIAKEQF